MPPLSLLIKPASGLCNMRCKYCFYADVKQHRSIQNYGVMTENTHETMVKMALQYGDHMVNFGFQGGEPTLCGLDFYKRHIKLCYNYNQREIQVTNSIQTNGYLIDEAWAEFLAKNNFLVGLSLDGTREIHDTFRVDSANNPTFERVMQTIKLFNKHKVQYNILCVVNNLVAKNADKVMNFFTSRGFEYIQFIPCLDAFEDSEQHDFSLSSKSYAEFLKKSFDKYYSAYKKGRPISVRNFDNYIGMLLGNPPESCGMGGRCNCYFVIEGDGSVFPCDFYVIDKYKLGNLNVQTFEQMQKSDVAKNFVRESIYVDPKCKECRWVTLCRGGCRRNREPFIDSKPSLNKFCEAYIEFYLYSIDRMREISQDILRKNQKKL